MNLEIKKFPNEVLFQVSEEVKREDIPYLIGIFHEIKEIIIEENGFGIASNQLGILKRFFYIPSLEPNSLIINPEIIHFDGKIILSKEGCLSIPGVYLHIRRYEKIKVKYRVFDFDKEVEKTIYGLDSFCFQHELDHLNGILILDKVSLYNIKRNYKNFFNMYENILRERKNVCK